MIYSSGILLGISGIIQLEITGLFDLILKEYGNDKKYPYGPPSYITREIIANPDRPYYEAIKSIMFINRKTGVLLIIGSGIVNLIATWI